MHSILEGIYEINNQPIEAGKSNERYNIVEHKLVWNRQQAGVLVTSSVIARIVKWKWGLGVDHRKLSFNFKIYLHIYPDQLRWNFFCLNPWCHFLLSSRLSFPYLNHGRCSSKSWRANITICRASRSFNSSSKHFPILPFPSPVVLWKLNTCRLKNFLPVADGICPPQSPNITTQQKNKNKNKNQKKVNQLLNLLPLHLQPLNRFQPQPACLHLLPKE